MKDTKRLNFVVSEIVDLEFRKQAEENGMGLSEYFKFLVINTRNNKQLQEKMFAGFRDVAATVNRQVKEENDLK